MTTPQDIALIDAKKGLRMFEKVNVPLIGIIENMSVFICPCCGKVQHIFGEGGAKRMGETYGVPLLGELPLSAEICRRGRQARQGLFSPHADHFGEERLIKGFFRNKNPRGSFRRSGDFLSVTRERRVASGL